MHLFVYVTFPYDFPVLEAAEKLVAAGAAAGVNIISGANSVFKWNHEIHKKQESLLIAQVAKKKFPLFKELLLKFHPYEVPCIVALPIIGGHLPFLNWIENPE